jgi:hypothetical protein
MTRALIVVVVCALSTAACGGSSSSSQGPTAATVAVQQTDVPTGMVRCDLTGDIDSFLSKEKTADQNTYQSTRDEWDHAKSTGAITAYAAFFADTNAHCTGITSSGADIGSATYKLVVNFVIQFKDEASAAKAYTSEKVFNFSASDLKASGQPVVEGDKTGLSANSITLSQAIGSQSFYIAVWQHKAFMVILAVLNVDGAASKKIATSENSRIK